MAVDAEILLVGHCGPDAYMLRSFARTAVPGATVTMVNDAQTLDSHLGGTCLLLVNRVLDGDFESTDGIGLIRAQARRDPPPAMMLVSNYPEAQEEAVKAGARPGFGKSQLGDLGLPGRLAGAVGLEKEV